MESSWKKVGERRKAERNRRTEQKRGNDALSRDVFHFFPSIASPTVIRHKSPKWWRRIRNPVEKESMRRGRIRATAGCIRLHLFSPGRNKPKPISSSSNNREVSYFKLKPSYLDSDAYSINQQISTPVNLTRRNIYVNEAREISSLQPSSFRAKSL